jgi:hypothetical protein
MIRRLLDSIRHSLSASINRSRPVGLVSTGTDVFGKPWADVPGARSY